MQAIQEGGKVNTLVLDFARNTARLGPINNPVLPRKKGNRKGDAPVKACPVCETYNHISARECFNCGNPFHFQTKIVPKSGNEELIAGVLPAIVEMKVDEISYLLNSGKGGKADTFWVMYIRGTDSYSEYVCFEHKRLSYPHNKAKHWWKMACQDKTNPLPLSVDEALEKTMLIRPATHIRVWTNKKPYPEVMDCCYDGSFFGRALLTPLISL